MSSLDRSQKSLIWRAAMCLIKGLINWIFMKAETDFHLTLIFVAFEWDSAAPLMSCVHSRQSCWTVIDTGCSGINMNDSVQTSITAATMMLAVWALCIHVCRECSFKYMSQLVDNDACKCFQVEQMFQLSGFVQLFMFFLFFGFVFCKLFTLALKNLRSVTLVCYLYLIITICIEFELYCSLGRVGKFVAQGRR